MTSMSHGFPSHVCNTVPRCALQVVRASCLSHPCSTWTAQHDSGGRRRSISARTSACQVHVAIRGSSLRILRWGGKRVQIRLRSIGCVVRRFCARNWRLRRHVMEVPGLAGPPSRLELTQRRYGGHPSRGRERARSRWDDLRLRSSGRVAGHPSFAHDPGERRVVDLTGIEPVTS